jgi:hypothetical protein
VDPLAEVDMVGRRSRNPLRRTSYRVEVWLTWMLAAVLLLLGPWLGWHAASATHRVETQANAYERQHRFEIRATLVEDAVWRAGSAGDGQPAPQTVPAQARWTARDATVHSGTVFAALGTPNGSTVTIWVDDSGAASGPPAHLSPTADAVSTALLVVSALASGLVLVRFLVRYTLERRRRRSWQREWVVVEPEWSRR